MPFAARHYCAYTGCHTLVSDPSQGYCEEHRHTVSRRNNHERTDSLEHNFYQRKAWKVVRETYLLGRPYCEEHLKQSQFVPAVMVHHVKSLKEHPELGLDANNLRALCEACHNAEHATERGGKHE